MKRHNPNALPPDQRKKLQAMIEADHNLEFTRKRLGISRYAMERAAGGLNIQAGTAALLMQKLAETSG